MIEIATELGQAYVQIIPSARGISGAIQSQLDPESVAAGKSAGGNLLSGMSESMGKIGGSLTKKITLPAIGAASAVGGIVAAFGWKRLVGMDSARAQLQGLGYDTQAVDRIAGQVRNSIQGTVTTMAEGTSVAAGALAAGVKEGADLERYIKLVGDAAVGANRPVADMAQIFNRVQGSGKLMTMELNMIEQGMPGFAQAMADSLGVPQDEFRKMVTQGKVSSEQFLNVMEGFAGEMSDAYASSWEGMVANTKSNIGIIGENILGGVFEQSKDSIADFLGYLRSDDVRAWAAETGEKLGETFTGIIETVKNAIVWWSGLDDNTKKLLLTLAGIVIAVGPVLSILSKLIGFVQMASGVFTTLKGVATVLGVAVGGISIPVLLAIAAIAAIIAIGVLLYKNWDTIKEKATAIWKAVGDTFEKAKAAITGTINNLKNTVTTKFNQIKTSITEPIRTALDTIKGLLRNLKLPEIKIPKIKLPHLKISGGFSIAPPKVPSFSVNWYDQGGIFTNPAIIGVGEKRPEFVGALDDLRYLIRGELKGQQQEIHHSGTIRVEGVTDKGQMLEVAELVVEDVLVRLLRKQARLAT